MKRSLYLLLLILQSCATEKLSRYHRDLPQIQKFHSNQTDKAYIQKSEYGIWELYAEGNPLERGLHQGAITDSIYRYQEEVFFQKVQELVPGKTRQWILRKFLSWYNRKLPKHIIDEYKEEIYGIAQYSSAEYNYIAPPFPRAMYLHAAHDIGHALQDLALVGCTSFASRNEEGELLLGRNFDFYAGDEFAKNKILSFIKPEKGYAYASYAWPGMVGVVSGMNEEGLTITLNAGKSNIPLKAKTPVSLLAKEILQYASNHQEALEIARKRKLFVSESLMIGSLKDNDVILLEISPKRMSIYRVEQSQTLLCTNHFQSKTFLKDRRNKRQIEESHSLHRYERLQELITPSMTVEKAAHILRDRGDKLGNGNDKAINHLLAHHAVIFEPGKKRIWVSTPPYNLGTFLAYDLEEVFSKKEVVVKTRISADPFLFSEAYAEYEEYRKTSKIIENAIRTSVLLEKTFFDAYIALNPELWHVYYLVGQYYEARNDKVTARHYYTTALEKELPSLKIEKEIKKRL